MSVSFRVPSLLSLTSARVVHLIDKYDYINKLEIPGELISLLQSQFMTHLFTCDENMDNVRNRSRIFCKHRLLPRRNILGICNLNRLCCHLLVSCIVNLPYSVFANSVIHETKAIASLTTRFIIHLRYFQVKYTVPVNDSLVFFQRFCFECWYHDGIRDKFTSIESQSIKSCLYISLQMIYTQYITDLSMWCHNCRVCPLFSFVNTTCTTHYIPLCRKRLHF